jgi:hypothetical protein
MMDIAAGASKSVKVLVMVPTAETFWSSTLDNGHCEENRSLAAQLDAL